MSREIIYTNRNEPAARRRHLWPRFTLRFLLLAITSLCVGFGILGIRFQRAREQRQLVEQIHDSFGMVSYDYGEERALGLDDPFGSPATPPAPTVFSRIHDLYSSVRNWLGTDFFYDVKDVWLRDRLSIKDLWRLRKLEGLSIGKDVPISEQDLASICRLKGIRRLSISDVWDKGMSRRADKPLGDDAIDEFAKLAALESLHVGESHLSPPAIERLSKFPALLNLEVYSYDVVDVERCLAPFKQARHIKHVKIARLDPNGKPESIAEWGKELSGQQSRH